jgi:anti-sigma regulatory factor (Ser/Thr protein kinase)
MNWYLRSADTAAVPPLRREIMRFLRHQAAPGGDFASAELVVGELLSNAVAHTSVQAQVSLRWEGDHPVLSVADLGRAAHSRVRRRRVRVYAGTASTPGTLPEAAARREVLPEMLPAPARLPEPAPSAGPLPDPARLPATPARVWAKPVLPEDPLADSGRGLFIADRLARHLAVAERAGSPVVSATLDLTRREPGGPEPE